jgi:hypothetical protein
MKVKAHSRLRMEQEVDSSFVDTKNEGWHNDYYPADIWDVMIHLRITIRCGILRDGAFFD